MSKRILKHIKIREKLIKDASKSGSDLLPSERDIAARFNVSRLTAKKALDSLVEDNLAKREIGKGSFFVRSPRRACISIFVFRGPREHPPMLNRLAEAYMRLNPEVDVRVEECHDINWYAQALERQGAKIVFHSNFGYMADVGYLQPLDEFDDFSEVRGLINNQVLKPNVGIDGREHIYSLPMYLTPTIFGYNRRIARDLGLSHDTGPRSWDELLEWTAAAAESKDYFATEFSRSFRFPVSFYYTLNGGNSYLVRDDDKMSFDFTHGSKWLSFFAEMSRVNGMVDRGLGKISGLVQGNMLFNCMAEPWVLHQSEEYGCREDMVLCPTPPVLMGEPSFSRIGVWAGALVRDDNVDRDEQRQAWDFLRYMATDINAQSIVCSAMPGLSVLDELYSRQQAERDWYPFILAMATGRVRNDLPIQHIVNTVVCKYFHKTVFDSMDAAQAAEEADLICSTLVELGSDVHSMPGISRNITA